MFNRKKTGIEALKEKLEKANEHMIETQKIMNEFYALLFEVENFEQNNTNN